MNKPIIAHRTHDSKAATMAQSFAPVRDLCAAAGLSTARIVAPGHVRVPSATVAGQDWHVLTCPNGALWCDCPADPGTCWHLIIAAALLGRPTPPASTIQARAAAALTDLYGEAVA